MPAEKAMGRWLSRRLLKTIVVLVALFAVYGTLAVMLYQPIGQKSPLAADQGTIAALRSAAAIYYGRNDGTFPTKKTLQTLIQGFNGTFQCRGATWSIDGDNGRITYAPNDHRSC
jgi:hypothetical protein